MAPLLRSDFEWSFPHPAAYPAHARSREQRRLERRLNRAARRREREQRVRSRRQGRLLPAALGNPGPDDTADGPGYLGWRVRGLIVQWFGVEPEALPLIVMDRRYWQARACGWEALSRDAAGRPCEPVAEWWDWWCGLRYQHRDKLVELSRGMGRDSDRLRGVLREMRDARKSHRNG